jgi:hypothetical protein
MSEFDLTEDLEPAVEPDEEEYEADEDAVVSPETGTVYDGYGEAETTPHDVEIVENEDEE